MIMMILWMIAGALIGWIAMDIIPLAIRLITTPVWYKLTSAGIGALTVYTIFN